MIEKITIFIKGCTGKYTWFLLFTLFIISISSFLVYKSGFNEGYNNNRIEKKEMAKIISSCIANDSLVSLENKIELSTLGEKLSAVNTRFDDLYVLGGIIIALIGIILVSVYIKSENDVKKHLDEKFDSHKTSIENILRESEQLLEQIRTSNEVASKMAKSGKINSDDNETQDSQKED